MATPSSPPISMSQVKAEFNLGNNLRAYLGCAPGVPTSGSIKLTDLLGKSASDYHYGFPNTFRNEDLGYYYDYVLNDAGRSGFYGTGNLDQYFGDNFGTYQPYEQTELAMAVVNSYDFAYVYNSYSRQWFCVDSDKFDSQIQTKGSWSYSNFVGSNAIYYYDYSNLYYNAAYNWLISAYAGSEYFMELQ